MSAGDYQIQVTLTDQAANCGDHAQDITHAVHVDPDETVRDLALRTLQTLRYIRAGEPAPIEADASKYLTIRLSTPAVTT